MHRLSEEVYRLSGGHGKFSKNTLENSVKTPWKIQ
jgi:hypothetical protein